MAQESFYFSHDYYSRSNRKLVAIKMKHGMEGVGVFWCLTEMLYEEGGYYPHDYENLCYELRVDESLIHSILNNFNLFQSDEEYFWSESVLERLRIRCTKSAKAKKSIEARWERLGKLKKS
jgi:hypothetical protein